MRLTSTKSISQHFVNEKYLDMQHQLWEKVGVYKASEEQLQTNDLNSKLFKSINQGLWVKLN